MYKQDLADAVTSLVADVLELPDMSALHKVHRDEIVEWDSLAHLRIFLAIEEKYALKIPIEEIFSVKTLEEIVEKLEVRIVAHRKSS